MAASENKWVARLTAISLSMVIFGSGIAWLDGRHASAGDLTDLKVSIDKDRLDRIEFEIDDIERLTRGIKRMSPNEQSSPEVQARILELSSRRERYLRKREELLIVMGDK